MNLVSVTIPLNPIKSRGRKYNVQYNMNIKDAAKYDYTPYKNIVGIPWLAAPTFSQVFRFFREKYGLHYCPYPKSHFPDNRINEIYHYEIFNSDGEEIASDDGTYIIGESLEVTVLEKLINIVELKNKL
jgi:hypothetical protein